MIYYCDVYSDNGVVDQKQLYEKENYIRIGVNLLIKIDTKKSSYRYVAVAQTDMDEYNEVSVMRLKHFM